MPELDEIPCAHKDDSLIARVIIKGPGDRELADALGRGQLDRFTIPKAMAASVTFRNKNARLCLKSTHDLRAVATHELEMPPLAAAHNRDGCSFLTHRQIHFAKGVHC